MSTSGVPAVRNRRIYLSLDNETSCTIAVDSTDSHQHLACMFLYFVVLHFVARAVKAHDIHSVIYYVQ